MTSKECQRLWMDAKDLLTQKKGARLSLAVITNVILTATTATATTTTLPAGINIEFHPKCVRRQNDRPE